MVNRPLVLCLTGALALWNVGAAMASDPSLLDTEELGRAQLIGSVYCDTDGDGKRDEGEPGLGGVEVHSDRGEFSETDREGRFHLSHVEPGQRLIKIDATTLAGAEVPEGGLLKHLHVTSGTMSRVSFALKCSLQRVGPDSIEIPQQGQDAPKLASTKALASTVLLAGHTEPAQVSLNGQLLPVNIARLDVDFPDGRRVKGGVNLPWRPGALKKPIVFKPEIVSTGGAPAAGASWRIDVRRVGDATETVVRSFFGVGDPPDRLSWDGTDPAQVFSVLEQGQLFRVRLRATDGHGAVSKSRPITFGVAYGQGGGVVERLVIRGLLFDQEMRPTKLLTESLGELEILVAENPSARLLIEVHTDDSVDTEMALSRTRRGAFLTAEALGAHLGMDRSLIDTLGYGSARPLLPNISERNRTFNRRIEVTLLVATDRKESVVLSTPVEPAGVWLQEERIAVGTDGLFLGTTPRSATGLISLRIVTSGGGSWERAVDLNQLSLEPASAAQDPLRGFGGAALRRALGDSMITGGGGDDDDTAGQIEVVLPASGAVLQSPWLYLQGASHPRNTVTVNGAPVALDHKGRFAERIPMPVGESALEIVSTDSQGFVARITRSYTVSDKAFFLMGLVDGASQFLGGHMLSEDSSNTQWKIGDSVKLAGRAALTFKGRIHGSKLARELFIVAHLDSGRRPEFEAFHEQHVDPSRSYAVFGDETTDQDLAARGPLYLLVQADHSKLTVANVRPDLRGLGLIRYDRALYGLLLELEEEFAKGYKTKLKAFVSEDTTRLRRGHDELRATGGSLYYLSRQEILEGSERVQVVVRERDSRMELSRRTLEPNGDYRIDPTAGRIVLKRPLSSTVLTASSLSMLQPFTTHGRQVQAGHEVWLEVDYESTDLDADRGLAGAVELRQNVTEWVTVTGGFVTDPGSLDDGSYQLYGGGIEAKLAEGTVLRAEVARSSGVDGASLISDDGGLRYQAVDRAPLEADAPTPDGLALRVELSSDVGESLERDDLDLKIRGWWQLKDTGFYGLGQGQERGTEKLGAVVTWRPSKKDTVGLRMDGQTTLTHDDPNFFVDGLREHRRQAATTSYKRSIGRFDVRTELGWAAHRDAAIGTVHQTQGVVLGGGWRPRDDMRLSLSQQSLFGGDDALLGEGAMPRQTTRVGVDYDANEEVNLGLSQAMSWDGANATMFSARGKLDDESHAYVGQQLGTGYGPMGSATVLGADSHHGDGLRSYSEYRLDDGVDGKTNRAVLGLGKRVPVADRVSLSGTYERSQTFGGAMGEGARDVISGGLELLPLDWLKFGSRYELRLDQRPIETDDDMATTIQALALHGLTLTLSPRTTAMFMANFDLTQDLASREVLREGLELSLSAMHRPRVADWLTLTGRVSRYQRRYTLSSEGLLLLDGEVTPDQRESIDVLGVAAILELTDHIELTEHATYRFRKWKSLEGATLRAQDLLSIHRLGYRILRYLDLSAEYRLLAMLDADEALKHGFLAEIAYAPGRHLATRNPYLRHMRIALGYDFSELPRALDPTLEDEPDGGVYVRITGAY